MAGDRQAEASPSSGALILPKLQFLQECLGMKNCCDLQHLQIVVMLRKTPGSPDAFSEAVKRPLFTY